MKKKRSVGVAIFGWAFIIINTVAFVTYGHQSPLFRLLFISAKESSWTIIALILIFYILYHLIHIIAGISILRLKAWGRKLVIILAIFGIVKIIAIAPISHKRIEESIGPKLTERLEKQYEIFPEGSGVKQNFSKEEYIKNGKRMYPILHAGINEIIPFIYMLLVIYFFTRPKVKEQFR
jgi:hypothetical protein